MASDTWTAVGIVIAAGSAVVAAFTYLSNTRTKRAEFLVGLHKSFFADPLYKDMKSILDSDEDSMRERLTSAVQHESQDFTDFLNFFELIAYLVEIGTLKREDAEALLSYYFDLLRGQEDVWNYISKTSSGFENLRRFLSDRETAAG